MTQTAGTITSSGVGSPYNFSGGSLTLVGGTFGSNNRSANFTNGAVFTLDGGTFIGGDKDATRFNGAQGFIKSGSFQELGTNRGIDFTGGGELTISGGTVSVDGTIGVGKLGTGANFLYLNGGTTTAGTIGFGKNNNGSQFTIQLGGTTAGTFTVGDFAPPPQTSLPRSVTSIGSPAQR